VARHRIDLISLLAGIAFTAAAVVLILTAITDITLDPKLALPIGLVALGVLGLIGSLIAQRGAGREPESAAAAVTPHET
jgi:hypothetical protein